MPNGKISSVLIFALTLETLAWAADPSPQATQAQQTMDARPTKASRKQARETAPLLNQETESNLKKAVASLNLIAARTPPGPALDKLLLGRAKANLSLAQLHTLQSKTTAQDAIGKGFLEASKKDLDAVLQNKKITASARAQALHLSGLTAIYLNSNAEALDRFNEALKLQSNSPDAGWMAFFIAEEHFEAQQYQKAVEYYRGYSPIMKSNLKRIAHYKMAWAHLNLNQPQIAESLFIGLIRSAPKEELSLDSIKDLAFLVTKNKDESQIISWTDLTFQDPSTRLGFLRAVHATREAQGISTLDSKILARLIEGEADPIRRLQLQFSTLNSVRREYASSNHLTAFLAIQKAFETQKLPSESKEYQALRNSLDSEAQRLIGSYLATFSNRVKSPENPSHTQVGQALKTLLEFHTSQFPNSTNANATFGVWLDVCNDLKDWVCVNELGQRIEKLNPAAPQPLKARARLDRIAALEELRRQTPSIYTAPFREALEQFALLETASPRWLPVAKRLAEIQLESKDYPAAIQQLDLIFRKELNQDNFYRLQWARYQDKRFKELSEDKRGAGLKGPPHEKMADILRETSLHLAIEAKKDGNAAHYGEMIHRFLASSPGVEKARVARRDYFGYLFEKSELNEANREFLSMPQQDRNSADYQDLLLQLCLLNLKAGEFSSVLELLKASSIRNDDLRFYQHMAVIGLDRKIEITAMRDLSQPRQEYLLSLLALVQPSSAHEFFSKNPPRTDEHRALALISLRIKKNQWVFQPSTLEAAWIGALLPTSMKHFPTTPFEKKLDGIRFPAPPKSASDRKFAKSLETLLAKVREARSGFANDLRGKPATIQLRILEKAKKTELHVAELLRGTPLPEGLSPEQVTEYKAGIEAVVKEFVDQADEFAKLEATATGILTHDESIQKEKRLPQPDLARWRWPDAPEKKVILSLLDHKRFAGALIVADLLKEGALKNEKDYYQARVGILLSSRESEVLRQYVVEELLQAKREDLVQDWKAMTQ